MWREQWAVFLTALMFLTRLPIPRSYNYREEYMQAASRYFPLVGLLVGSLSALVYVLAGAVLPSALAVLLSMISTVLLTGAFHEDGFADSCDGFGGGVDKASVLRIMKDSRVGSYAVVGVCLLLATKFSALFAFVPDLLPWVLIVGHGVSRLVAVSLLYTLTYVRDDESAKSKPLSTHLGRSELLFSLCTIVPFYLLLLNWFSATGLIIVTFVLIVLQRAGKHYLLKRIGGYTGDCLGAMQQLSEVVFYFVLLAVY